MKPEGSLPHSQKPSTFPNSEPDQSSPCLPSHFLRFSHLSLGLPSGLFASGILSQLAKKIQVFPERDGGNSSCIRIDGTRMTCWKCPTSSRKSKKKTRLGNNVKLLMSGHKPYAVFSNNRERYIISVFFLSLFLNISPSFFLVMHRTDCKCSSQHDCIAVHFKLHYT
jgi:hypothetical protein